ncbi:MAG: DegV family protein [Lachnospiraceae bacterium]|jgi:DegV family protein with EDD domain|nr:DegV family protein [Lachnospiraceae bacterium]
MKIAIVTDSNSGITQKEGKERGIFVLPMPFMINGTTYFEDIDLSQSQFYDMLEDGADISTSQPSPASVTDLWDSLLKEYQAIVHIPMSSGLSSSCQTAMMLAQDYEGKVWVVNNQRISVTQRQSVFDAKEMAEKGFSAAEVKEKLEEVKFESSIYIMVDTLKYLKKGGRITPAAAALGTLLRIKPVLQIQGEKLDAFSKVRTLKQAKTVMLAAMQKDLENRFQDPEAKNTHLEIAHTQNQAAAEEFKKELSGIYPEAEIVICPLSLSVSCHIGPGSLAIACSKKVEC